MKRDRYPMPGKQPATSKIKVALMDSAIKTYDIEIMHPGVAFFWDETSTGLRIKTNLSPENINKRGPNALFKSDKAVWSWALRIRDTSG